MKEIRGLYWGSLSREGIMLPLHHRIILLKISLSCIVLTTVLPLTTLADATIHD